MLSLGVIVLVSSLDVPLLLLSPGVTVLVLVLVLAEDKPEFLLSLLEVTLSLFSLVLFTYVLLF